MIRRDRFRKSKIDDDMLKGKKKLEKGDTNHMVKTMLQDEIISADPTKNDEIVNTEVYMLAVNIGSNAKYITYTKYFNQHCVPEYRKILLKLIITQLEKEKQLQKLEILEIFRLYHLFLNIQRRNINLREFITKTFPINWNRAAYRLGNSIYDIIQSNGDFNRIINNPNAYGFLTFILNLLNKTRRSVKQVIKRKIRTNTMTEYYLDFLIKNVTNDEIKTFDDFIADENNFSVFSFSVELRNMIKQYINCDQKQMADFATILERIANSGALTVDNLVTHLQYNFENVFLKMTELQLTSEDEALTLVNFFNIVRQFEIPFISDYYTFLFNYVKNYPAKKIRAIINRGDDIYQLNKEKIMDNIIDKLPNNTKEEVSNHALFYRVALYTATYENELLLHKITLFFHLMDGKLSSLNEYFDTQTMAAMAKLTEIEVLKNIDELTYAKVLSDYENKAEAIKDQIDKMKNNEQFYSERPENKTVVIAAPEITEGFELFDIFTIFHDCLQHVNRMEQKVNQVSKEQYVIIKNRIKEILFDKIFAIFRHFVFALNAEPGTTLSQRDESMSLFYWTDSQTKTIKVHVSNTFERILLLLLTKLNRARPGYKKFSLLEFVSHSMFDFYTTFKFMNRHSKGNETLQEQLESNIGIGATRYDIGRNITQIFQRLSVALYRNKLKPFNMSTQFRLARDKQKIHGIYNQNVSSTNYKIIEKMNRKHNILSSDELFFLALNLTKPLFRKLISNHKKNKEEQINFNEGDIKDIFFTSGW